MTAAEIINYLEMKPLPVEGGYYKETHRSTDSLTDGKALYTAIYYLLTPQTQSALHWLPTDEIFHFYLGDPVTMLNLFEDGSSGVITLGQDILSGDHVQYKVPAKTWQGSFLQTGGNFALMGTTMAPGFDFSDLKIASPSDQLTDKYPKHEETITKLITA